jgi:glycine/D-amino acid oxidase-like deaminating enzyme
MTADIDKTLEEAKAAVLPFESWERLAGESGLAYAAFRAYRDYGPDRNIRKAVETALAGDGGEAGTGKGKVEKRYRMWRAWAGQFRWRERAADYDRYLGRLKQTEARKTIEEQGEAHRAVTKKMLEVVMKKLDLMKAEELTQGAVKEWVEAAIKADREAAGLVTPNGGKAEPKQLEIQFTPEFEGL